MMEDWKIASGKRQLGVTLLYVGCGHGEEDICLEDDVDDAVMSRRVSSICRRGRELCRYAAADAR